MTKIPVRLFAGCACLLVFAVSSAAQTNSQPKHDDDRSTTAQILGGTGKVAVVVVGSAAKIGWEVTKFTAAYAAKPVAKTLLVKGAPKAAVLMLKTGGLGAKYLLPLALKLSVL